MYPIPANATRIRYLESTGTQYVDTGIVPDATTAVDLRGRFLADAGKTRFGSRVSNGTAQMCVISVSSNKIRIDVGTGVASGRASASQWEYTTEVCSSIVIDARTNSASVTTSGGTVISHAYSASATFSGALSMSAFAFNNGGTIVGATEMRVSALQITQSGVLVRSFVPVRVGQVGYLFDRVSGQLFGNAGTGDFVLGPDTFQQGVLPTRMMVMGVRKKPYDAEVEYLQNNTGLEYVNTGIIPDDTTEVYATTKVLNQNTPAYSGGDNAKIGCGEPFSYQEPTFCFTYHVGQSQFYIHFVSGYQTQSIALGTTVHTIRFSKSEFSVDGVKKKGPFSGSLQAVSPICIWAFPGASLGSIHGSRKTNFYSVQIYKESVLVRDYIPVRVGTVGYLYDKVSKQLFGNAGTGAFVLGPDK